jgi:hypothetical protein
MDKRSTKCGVTRRSVLMGGGAAVAAATLPGFPRPALAQGLK